MSAFDESCDVGRAGVGYAMEFMRQRVPGCELIDTSKMESVSEPMQKYFGDFLIQFPNGGRAFGVEVKTERKWTGNLYLETWSNKAFGRQTEGWMVCLRSQWLLYVFLGPPVRLYSVNFPTLWTWFFGGEGARGAADRLAERLTGATQPNKTHGRLAPIRTLMEQCGMREFTRGEAGVWEEVVPEAVTA